MSEDQPTDRQDTVIPIANPEGVSPSEQSANDATNKPKSKIPLESTEFFGPRGWTAVLLPYLVMLIGLQLASYFENARVHTHIKQLADQSTHVIVQVTQMLAEKSPATLDKLEQDFAWKDFAEDLKLVGMGEHYVFDEVEGMRRIGLERFRRGPSAG